MPIPARHPACEDCRYWQEEPDAGAERLGVCRRMPPAYEGWPMTRAQDWCGEHGARAEPVSGRFAGT